MESQRRNLEEVEKIQRKLEEAREIATRAGFEPDSTGKDAANPTVPATITPLVDMAIKQCKDVKWNLAGRPEESG